MLMPCFLRVLQGDGKAAQEIGAVSKEINSLTVSAVMFLPRKVMLIKTYIYNVLSDALSSYRIHNNLQTLFSKYIHIQSKQSCNHSHTHTRTHARTHAHTQENSL